MSNIKELIREKIDAFYTEYKAKFHQNGDSYHLGIIDGLDMAERILDTLPDESEQPTRGYDEAYLDEKIAKASKSWEGVDVDKFMDEIRGREKTVTDCHDLTEAAEKYADGPECSWVGTSALEQAFISGAKWGAEHLRDSTKKMSDDLEEAADEYSGDSNTGFIDMTSYRAFIAGAEWMKAKMMKEGGECL